MSYNKHYQVIIGPGPILDKQGEAKFDAMVDEGKILDIRQTIDLVENHNVQLVQGYIKFESETSADEYFNYITDHFVDLREVVKFG